MFLSFDDDQIAFGSGLRKMLDARIARFGGPAGLDDESIASLWTELCVGMGVLGLHVEEEYGGSGATYVETAVAMRELGRALAPVSALTNVWAIELIRGAADDEQKRRLLPGLVAGTRIAGVPADDGGSVQSASTVELAGERSTFTLTGRLDRVLGGAEAHVVVLTVRDGDGANRVAVVDLGVSGVTRQQRSALDLTRSVASFDFDESPVEVLNGNWTPTGLLRVIDVMKTLFSFEILGAAEQILEIAVGHAKVREQFNRPIGSFQAIKHLCAEAAIELDAAEAVAMLAVACLLGGPLDAASAAAAAKAQTGDAFTRAASSAIQVLGGIGFTWEHPAHLYFRRAKSSEVLFGTARTNRMQLLTS